MQFRLGPSERNNTSVENLEIFAGTKIGIVSSYESDILDQAAHQVETTRITKPGVESLLRYEGVCTVIRQLDPAMVWGGCLSQ